MRTLWPSSIALIRRNKDPELWANVLAYFSTRGDAEPEIIEVLLNSSVF